MRNLFAKSNDPSPRARSLSPSSGGASGEGGEGGRGGGGGGDPLTNYSSFPSTKADDSTNQASLTDYRGFSTPIGSIFRDTDAERVDCCAITCCGVLQTDRDRFLLQGVPPPPPLKRCLVHFILPMILFLTAGVAAMHLSNRTINQFLSTALILCLVLYFCLQCAKGRAKRIGIRKDLLWLKYQIMTTRRPPRNLLTLMDQDRPDADGDDSFLMGQSRRDISCAHPCFWIGCYRADSDEYRSCCGWQLQVCGMCAIAQEARDLERFLPTSYRRIDYITMQPWVDYYPAIYQRKYNLPGSPSSSSSSLLSPSSSSSSWTFFPPLSKLAVRILQGWVILTCLLLTWGVVGPLYWKYVVRTGNRSHAFSLADFGIYLLTFVEAIGVLSLVAFVVSRTNDKSSELSSDAYIKYFAAGFCLSTSLAVFWELAGSVIIKIILSLALSIAGIDEAAAPDTNSAQTQTGGASLLQPLFWSDTRAETTSSRTFLDVFGKDHPVVYTIYLLVNAFLLAALIEEVCKYFGYRMVEHPDFMSRRDLEKASKIVHSDEDAYYDDENDKDVELQTQLRRQRLHRQASQDYSMQRQSLQSQGAAVTLAMVAVAMGFTCCENLVYVFIYSSSSPRMELYVLMSRALFPVHPIAAALQAIGVCRRDLEGIPTSLFQIIFPAVLFHGAYDFFILWIDFFDKRHGVYADEGSEDVSVVAVVMSFVVSVLVVLGSVIHLWRQSKQQRQRLADMDRQASVDQSNLL